MSRSGAPRLLVVATHPIQYQAPLFRALAASGSVDLTVAFLDLPDAASQGVGFGVAFAWDVPVTEGYRWVRLDARVRQGPAASHFLGRSLRHAVRALRVLSPDVVLVMGWNQIGLLQAWVAARLLRVPLIVRGDSNAKRARSGWKRYLHKAMLGIPCRFIAVGRSNAEFYRESGVPVSKILSAPHFVDNAFFARHAASVDRAMRRASWGVADSDVCILFAGKFEAKKRPFDLLEAVAQLPDDARERVVVLMVGTGALEESLRARADRARIRVRWAGFLNQTEIPAAYAVADLLVLPSDHGETWGLVVNEAMACGLPAVVSDQVGCADDLVRSGETGIVYPMGDVPALARSISRLIERETDRRAMGVRAKAVVTEAFSLERSVEVIEGAVADLAGQPVRQSRAWSRLG